MGQPGWKIMDKESDDIQGLGDEHFGVAEGLHILFKIIKMQ